MTIIPRETGAADTMQSAPAEQEGKTMGDRTAPGPHMGLLQGAAFLFQEPQGEAAEPPRTGLKWSRIFDLAPVASVVTDRDGVIRGINRAGTEMLRCGRGSLIGRRIAEFVAPPDLSTLAAHQDRALECRGREDGELRLTIQGEPLWVRVLSTPVHDSAGAVEGVHSVFLDIPLRDVHGRLEQEVGQRTAELEKINLELRDEIARRAKFEKALQFSTNQVIEYSRTRKLLARRLVELLEQDRRDMAMALHDHIGQILTTLKMDLELLRKRVLEEDARAVMDAAIEMASQAMSFSRNISQELRPAMLDTLGLVPSIENLITQVRRSSGMEINFFHKGITRKLGDQKELTLYRILQEALTNILKHASARSVDVTLIRKENSVLLTVEDDGAGFERREITSSEKGPLGIMIMKERAVQVGGTVDIESRPGKGTHVAARVPLQEGR